MSDNHGENKVDVTITSAWKLATLHKLAKHLNRCNLILSNPIVYAVDDDDEDGLANFSLDDSLSEPYHEAWVTLDWAIDNLRDAIREVCKNAYWKKYKYKGIIAEAARCLRSIKSDIKVSK